MIEASVLQSLRSLRTDHVDVLALHEPTPEEAADKRIFDVLERLLDRELIRAISLPGPLLIERLKLTIKKLRHEQFGQSRRSRGERCAT
jgi:predicted oxidoreductase